MNIRDLAKIIGVSPATVSLALNNKEGVSDSTRQMIQEAAHKHNYVAKTKNTTIKNGQSILFIKYRTHGMLVDENAEFISTVIDSMEKRCNINNINFVIRVIDHDFAIQLQTIDYQQYIGVIVLGTELSFDKYKLLKLIPIPFIVLDNNVGQYFYNTVSMDNDSLTFIALQYIKNNGFTEIGHLKSKFITQNFQEREYSFHTSAKKLDLKIADIIELTPTLIHSYEDMMTFLHSNKIKSKAYFADNDVIAIGVLRALKQTGMLIPEDVSIIGFDDISYSKINNPPLTTMKVYNVEMGIQAVEQLLFIIDNPNLNHYKIRVGGVIKERQSVKAFK